MSRFLNWSYSAVVLAAVAAAMALVAHASVTQNEFVWDDEVEVVHNRSIQDLSRVRAVLQGNRPVVNLSYAIDYRMWRGVDEHGFHLTNLRLHVVVVLLLFAFVRIVVRDMRFKGWEPGRAAENVTAFTAAALLAVHPMTTETVGYVSSRSELLCGAFALASLLCFRQAMQGKVLAFSRRESATNSAPSPPARTPVGWGWLAVALAFWGLAVGSKETGGMLPFVFLAYDALLGPGERDGKRARLWRVHVPLISLIVVGGIARVWLFLAVEHPGIAPAPAYAFWSSAHVAVRYVGLLFVPVDQTIVHVVSRITSLHDRRILEALLGLGLSAIIALAARRRAPLVSFGIVFFYLLLVPSSALTLLSAHGQVMSEHRTYVASFGFFMAVGAIVGSMWMGAAFARGWWRPAAAVVFVAALAVLISLTVARNRVWRDQVSLWSDAAEKAPNTWLAVYGLAESYRATGQCRAALEPYRKAVDLQPAKPDTYLGYASCLRNVGSTLEALQVLRSGMSRAPESTVLILALASMEERQFRNVPVALQLCQSALKISPGSDEAKSCVERNEKFLADRQQQAR